MGASQKHFNGSLFVALVLLPAVLQGQRMSQIPEGTSSIFATKNANEVWAVTISARTLRTSILLLTRQGKWKIERVLPKYASVLWVDPDGGITYEIRDKVFRSHINEAAEIG